MNFTTFHTSISDAIFFHKFPKYEQTEESYGVPRLGHDSPQIHKSRKPEESAPKNEETSIRKPNDSAGSAPSNSQKPTDSAPVDKSQKPADSEPDPVRKPTGGDSY